VTPEDAKTRIEAAFGKVNSTALVGRHFSFPTPNSKDSDSVTILVRNFSPDGERNPGDRIALRTTPEDALAAMVQHIEGLADRNAELFWRQYPMVEYWNPKDSPILEDRELPDGWAATCRLAWWDPNAPE